MTGMMAVMASHKRTVAVASPTLALSFVLNNSSSWPGSGTTITDLSGNGRNGTLLNSPTTSSTSITTAANGFTPKCITTSYNLPASNWTVRMIANVSTSQTYWNTLWGNDYWSGSQGFIAYSPSNTTIWLGAAGGGNGVNYTSGGFQGASKQYDFTYDGTNYKIYINGSLQVTSSTYSPPTVATSGLFFGTRHQNGGGNTQTDGCNAIFYLMQVYTSALSSTQISTDYTNNKTTYGI